MLVLAEVSLPTDVPYWVNRNDFFDHFDQFDFHNREVTNVRAVYLRDWFLTDANGSVKFLIPIVSASGNRTDLIGTRHRLAVILPYLEELPFAFATGHLQADAQRILDAIPKRPLDMSEPFWIPDFPVQETLSESNSANCASKKD